MFLLEADSKYKTIKRVKVRKKGTMTNVMKSGVTVIIQGKQALDKKIYIYSQTQRGIFYNDKESS